MRGVPKHIRSDNGPEFIAQAIRQFLRASGRGDAVHRAGQPVAERLCRELPQPAARASCSTAEVFENVAEAQCVGRRPGRSDTTTTGRTAAWATRPPPSSRRRVLLPLRLRLRSSSTPEDKKHYPLPNPYSHNPWYKKRGQVTGTWVGTPNEEQVRGPLAERRQGQSVLWYQGIQLLSAAAIDLAVAAKLVFRSSGAHLLSVEPLTSSRYPRVLDST